MTTTLVMPKDKEGTRTVQGTLEAIDFDTKSTPVYDLYGKKIDGYQRLWRPDTGATLSIMTDEYKLVQHREVMTPAVEVLGKDGWTVRASRVQRDGAAAFVELWRPNHGVKVVGEQVGERILMKNTYDGTTQLSIQIGAVVLVCLNGAVVPGTGSAGFTSRHTGDVNDRVEFMHKNIRRIEEGLASKMIEAYSKLDTAVSPEIGKEIIKRTLGERQTEKPLNYWTRGIGRNGNKTAWNLYNGITQYLTYDFGGSWSLRERKNEQAFALIAKYVKEGRLPVETSVEGN